MALKLTNGSPSQFVDNEVLTHAIRAHTAREERERIEESEEEGERENGVIRKSGLMHNTIGRK